MRTTLVLQKLSDMIADPGFYTIVSQLADLKFPFEIRCSSKVQYLKKNNKKIFIL